MVMKMLFDSEDMELETAQWTRLQNWIDIASRKDPSLRFDKFFFSERLFSTGPTGSLPCVVMQYYLVDLNLFLKSKQAKPWLDESVAAVIIHQIYRCLFVMHHVALMIHLDIKPSNVLLRPFTWDTVLTDLGLVQNIGVAPRTCAVVTHYIGPLRCLHMNIFCRKVQIIYVN